MATVEKKKSAPRSGSRDSQVRELLGLFSGVVKGLKRGREEEKPEELQRAFDEGSLGERHFPPLIVLSLEGPMSVTELAEKVGITMANISVLKNGKVKAIRLSTMEAVCKALDCQPGDILEYKKEG